MLSVSWNLNQVRCFFDLEIVSSLFLSIVSILGIAWFLYFNKNETETQLICGRILIQELADFCCFVSAQLV